MSTDTSNSIWPDDDNGAFRRLHRRWYVDFKSILKAAGVGMNCAVYDLSPGGVCVEPTVPRAIGAGDRVDFELPGYGSIPTEVRYNDNGHLGLKFLHDGDGTIRVARYLIRSDKSRRGQGRESVAKNQDIAGPTKRAVESDSERPTGLASLSLQDLEAQMQAAARHLAETQPRDKGSDDALNQLDGAMQELILRGGRFDDDVQNLRQERDRLSRLLEALVEQLEVHVDQSLDEMTPVAGDGPSAQSARFMTGASSEPNSEFADVILDMRRRDDPDIVGDRPKAKAKALMDRLRRVHGEGH